MQSIKYFISDSSLTVFVDGRTYTVDETHANFMKIRSGLVNGSYIDTENLINDIDNAKLVEASFESNHVKVKNGVVKYVSSDGTEYHIANALTNRLQHMLKRRQNADHLVKFLENVMQNPSQSSIMELYEFLEVNDLPITGDGCFLAYKKIRLSYRDLHSGQFDNSIGQTVEMRREDVDPDRNVTCSTGLHFASWDYMNYYGGRIGDGFRVVIVKINPRDVVSFPTDYNNAKGRCARYEVVAELPGEEFRLRPNYAESEDEAIVHEDWDELEEDEVDYVDEGVSFLPRIW